MVKVEFTKEFQQLFSKIKDDFTKQRILKQVEKLKTNPEVGKPMRNVRKGTRELYVKPYRLSYEYDEEKDLISILDLYHKKRQ